MLTLLVCRGPHSGKTFSLDPPPNVKGAANNETIAVLGRHPPENAASLRYPKAPFFGLPDDAKLSIQQGAFILRTVGGAGSGCVVSEYRDLGSTNGSVVFPFWDEDEEKEGEEIPSVEGRALKGRTDVRVTLQRGCVIRVGRSTLKVTSVPFYALPDPVFSTAVPAVKGEAAADAGAIDPITILILCAANGYAADIQRAGCLSRDPDLWSYLAKAPVGRRGNTWLHGAARLGHADRAYDLVYLLGVPWGQTTVRGNRTACHLAAMSGNLDTLTILAVDRLEKGLDDIDNLYDATGRTPFDYCARKGWLEGCLCLMADCDILAFDFDARLEKLLSEYYDPPKLQGTARC